MIKKLLIITVTLILTVLLFTGCPSSDEADTAGGIDTDIYGYWLECNAIGQIDGVNDWGFVVYYSNALWEIYVSNLSTVYVEDYVGTLVALNSGTWQMSNGYYGTYSEWYDQWISLYNNDSNISIF